MKLICYLSNGYPSLQASAKMARLYADAGCDAIEIDFPSRDPYLEGELISGRMREALAACDDYGAYMDQMAQVKCDLPDTEFILLAYESTVREIGVDRFLRFSQENGYRDMILVGLTGEKTRDELIAGGLRVSCYVQFHLPEDQVKHALTTNGFTYLQAVPEPGQATKEHPTLASCISYLRGRGLKNPIYCGVGVHAPDDAAMCKDAGADGVFVGSTILKLHNDPVALGSMIREFKANC
ncbi:MAG: tryptophan synthase subunit alpha [Atopobiaceae bacterium]|jgi:tryptophan synthase alpha chain